VARALPDRRHDLEDDRPRQIDHPRVAGGVAQEQRRLVVHDDLSTSPGRN
jgi:hypothetical protein